ncbi:MAG TPA: hypothetical protein VFH61_10960 [Thermoleophilia bacterium]|nr:hypothetical protein [Thermoleophilia bacterium]
MELGAERLAQLLYVTGHRSALRGLRLSGLLLLGFGVIPLSRAIESVSDPTPWAVGMLVLGVLLGGVGLWNVIAPSVRGLGAQGAAVGVFAISAGVYALWATGGGHVDTATWIVAICFLPPFLIWGGWALIQYRQHRRQFPAALSAEAVAFAKQLITNVRQSDAGRSEHAIEFKTRAAEGTGVAGRAFLHFAGPLGALAGAQRVRWRGLLFSDAAVMVSTGRDVLAGTREDVSIVPQGSPSRRGARKAILEVGQITLAITMSQESLDRFVAWKVAPAEVPVALAPHGAL